MHQVFVSKSPTTYIQSKPSILCKLLPPVKKNAILYYYINRFGGIAMKLMVIDGNSIVNRAFYGVSQTLTTRDGFPTNAIFGFLNILHRLESEENPDALCVTFDLRAPTFRHIAYSGYKAHRKGMPEELAIQMPVLKEVLSAMNIPCYALEGWEADDLIGTIAAADSAAGWNTVIVTGDKDSLQLISDRVTVKLVSTRMGKTTTKDMTPLLFREEYGFDPIHMIDLKALMGDASDNIPGVPGIGEKTAMSLIQRYESVAQIYANFDSVELKPAARRKMDEGRDMASLSYDLATIRCNAPLSFSPEDALRKPFNEPLLYEKLLHLEFSKLIEKWNLHPASSDSVHTPSNSTPVFSVEAVDLVEEDQFSKILPLLKQAPYVVILPLPGLSGVTVSVQDNDDHEYLFDVRDYRYQGDYQSLLRALFSSEIRKVAHGVKDLCRELLEENLSTDGFIFDTELAAYLLDPTAGSYNLRRLVMSYFKKDVPIDAAYKDESAFSPLSENLTAQTEWYEDIAWIDALYVELKQRLTDLDMLHLLTDIELPLCPVLAQMEYAGFLVDQKALSDFGVMLTEQIIALESSIYELAGHKFNINSTQQFGKILFEELGLPPVKKTKTGYSTNAEVLEKLRFQHPIVEQVLQYRQFTKLNSTYVEGLRKVIAADGRIHTSFQNTVTATGRLSSTEPNLQNIPVRTELGSQMRKMFIASPGHVLVDADYSQIELRLLAHMANDNAMIDAFSSGTDIHTMTAAQVLGVPISEITKAQRSSAKAVNFGIVYGISAFSLSQDIHISVASAKEYMDRYFNTYSGVARYQKDIVEFAKANGYVSTLMGRRRWIPELKSSNFNQRAFGERVAMNAPIQGTAADVIKMAMIKVFHALKSECPDARLVLQVHDELIVECPHQEAELVKNILTREMEGVVQLSVPLIAEAESGSTWAECH